MIQQMRTAHATRLALRKVLNLQLFFDGLLEYAKQTLEKSNIGGPHEYCLL